MENEAINLEGFKDRNIDQEAPVVHSPVVQGQPANLVEASNTLAQIVTKLDASLYLLENRVSAIEEQIKLISHSFEMVLVNMPKQEALQDLLNKPLKVGPVTVTFTVLPRQDVWLEGANQPGKDGLSLTVDDGTGPAVVAKVIYDHQLKRFIAQTGKGVF